MTGIFQNLSTIAGNPAIGLAWLKWRFAPEAFGQQTRSVPFGGSIGDFQTFTDFWSFDPPSPNECRLMEAMLPAGGVAIDVGANVGGFSVAIGKLRPTATVHAFEPVPSTFSTLMNNCLRNQLANVWPHNVALGDKVDTLRMTTKTVGSTLNHVATNGEAGVDVPCTTLDVFLAEQRIEKVDFLKLDVEGYEPLVLQGAADALARGRIRCLLIEVGPHLMAREGSSVSDLTRALRPHGYLIFRLTEDGRPGDLMEDGAFNTTIFDRNYVIIRQQHFNG